jgi:hypothetical protein
MTLSPDADAYLPHHCLAPGGKEVKALVISNTRLALPGGRTFAQASLSNYYQGMYAISRPKDPDDAYKEGIFLPVRSFNSECLDTSEGKSVISCLIDNCDYVIIEDADLRPQNLVEHMETYSLHSTTIYDMTKVLGLTGNHAYVIWQKSRSEKAPEFGGECIW